MSSFTWFVVLYISLIFIFDHRQYGPFLIGLANVSVTESKFGFNPVVSNAVRTVSTI
jgi:hypothetical protein